MVYSRMPFGPPSGTDPLAALHMMVMEKLIGQQLITMEECAAYCEGHASHTGAQIAERLRAEAERLRAEMARLKEGQ